MNVEAGKKHREPERRSEDSHWKYERGNTRVAEPEERRIHQEGRETGSCAEILLRQKREKIDLLLHADKKTESKVLVESKKTCRKIQRADLRENHAKEKGEML